MKNKFLKSALLLGTALAISISGFAQEEKYKEERDGYERKIKREDDELKIKEKGRRPRQEQRYILREGRTVTTVKKGTIPKEEPVAQQKPKKVAKKRTYASRKVCTCRTVRSKSHARKHSVAYKPKRKTSTAKVAAAAKAPTIVRDTVMMVRVDTVFRMNETSSYTGYRSGLRLRDDFKKMKIKKDGDEIILKKEYDDGDKVKKVFDSEEDLNTYLKWRNY